MSATTVSASRQIQITIPVRKITNADANAALREGWADFMDDAWRPDLRRPDLSARRRRRGDGGHGRAPAAAASSRSSPASACWDRSQRSASTKWRAGGSRACIRTGSTSSTSGSGRRPTRSRSSRALLLASSRFWLVAAGMLYIVLLGLVGAALARFATHSSREFSPLSRRRGLGADRDRKSGRACLRGARLWRSAWCRCRCSSTATSAHPKPSQRHGEPPGRTRACCSAGA